MQLYQFAFGYRPHYVVARDYAEAETLISEAGYASPERIDCLGPYVLLPTTEGER